MNELISIGDKRYYISFEALDKLISHDISLAAQNVSEVETKVILDSTKEVIGEEITTRTYQKSKEIDGARYDTLGLMLNILLTTDLEIDDALGFDRGLANAPLNWKIAFNTLIKYGILIIKK